MRFHFGPPPTSLTEKELVSGQWRRLPFFSGWIAYLASLTIGVGWALLVLLLWVRIGGRFTLDPRMGVEVLVTVSVALVLGVVVQLLALLWLSQRRQLVIGVWPSRFRLYWVLEGPLSKWRFVATLLLPAVLLVALPIAGAALVGARPAWLSIATVAAAFGYGSHAIWAVLLAASLPSAAQIDSNGLDLYWRDGAAELSGRCGPE